MAIAGLLCCSLPSCSGSDAESVSQSSIKLAKVSLEIGINESSSDARSLSVTSQGGKPMLSQMTPGQEIWVHLFFSNGTQTSYNKQKFTVTKNQTLRLENVDIPLKGFTSDADLRDWYICGYIGGTATSENIDNKEVKFDGNPWLKPKEGEAYTLAYPYAFPWTKFQWKDLKATTGTKTILEQIRFKPQGKLVRLRLTYQPTAAPYQYNLTGVTVNTEGIGTNPSIKIPSGAAPVAGSYNAFTSASSNAALSYPISSITMKEGESTDTYWCWIPCDESMAAPKFSVNVKGEPIYPSSGNVIKSLLKETQTATISIADKHPGVSPAYNVKFNPERPLLPIEFMAYGDANGDKSEAEADNYKLGNEYLPSTVYQYTGSGVLPKSNRYLPSPLDMTSVIFSSVPDDRDPSVHASDPQANNSSWFSFSDAVYNYDNEKNARTEEIRIQQAYSDSDAKISKLKYSHSLKSKYTVSSKETKMRIVYGLRLIGDGNKRLSAWRYQYEDNKGIKIEAVYLGPKWEHASKVAAHQALQYVNNENFWTNKRASGEVIRRYLNIPNTNDQYKEFWSIAENGDLAHRSLGRYVVSKEPDNRGKVYNAVEFDYHKVIKVRQREGGHRHSEARDRQRNISYVRFFKTNPYQD